ncbi:MAG: NAD-glutamate dehydrogenase, partial [Mycobacteriaceae bacterium]
EAADLLRWLADGHFTILGYRRYEVTTRSSAGGAGGLVQRAVLGSGLGLLRDDDLQERTLDEGSGGSGRELLVLTQASTPTRVLRPVYPYFVGVATFGDAGEVTGEHRFLGVFTIAALNDNVLDIPVLARRTRTVIERAGYDLNSYSGQAMLEIVQTYPRTELFSTDTNTLFDIVTAVVALGQRRSVRLFLREDAYGRFVSCMVYLPRDRYTTRARTQIQDVLLRELGGSSLEYTARVSESPLALVHFTVQTPQTPELDDVLRARLQEQTEAACRTWDDSLLGELEAAPREEVNARVMQRYAQVLPESYKEDFSAAHAISDVQRLESLLEGEIDVALYRQEGGGEHELRFALYLAGGSVSLSRMLPVLQSMDVEVLDERPYMVDRPDGLRCWIYDFGLQVERLVIGEGADALASVRQRFVDTFTAAWHGRAEVDGFNALVLRAGLDWRQAMLLRGYAKYLRQVGLPYSQSYVEDVLVGNPGVCRALLGLFAARLDPAQATDQAAAVNSAEQVHAYVAEVAALIDDVMSLDADRILRAYLSLIEATLRTNYYVSTEGPRPYLSFKLDPRAIAELPKPRPRFEIFVYSPRVEGVHLRFGAVARGGLRWSDRREDFRTEVLGLAKAQAVKNAVIVPVGAKGGFVVKQPPVPTGDAVADREAFQAEGIACYRTFIRGLLDLTDNLDPVAGTVLPPKEVLRHDGDDTYLVVAADKGTASFSDIANGVAADYGYWLGDAFASGGSAGYDHKAMGITARGGWESVKRHFRELGVDTQSEDFTVVGIGDMSGDVFGNGMLLSEHIRLVAAFDHRHVFLDPEPVAKTSFAERRRVFGLGRSSWADYDTSLISEGGGVWSRTLKSVPISGQMRSALGLESDVDKLSPAELVHAILLAPADLLWNGGIGTYVKAGGETHAEVGDKANDGLRVNGSQLGVKVVGEGGNLGVTQRGRIEFARAGGHINTDALDNSAGVDCSDHEVNIKILLDALVTDGAMPVDERNPLLESMTGRVAGLVLADNDDQNELMGLSRANARLMVGVHARLV